MFEAELTRRAFLESATALLGLARRANVREESPVRSAVQHITGETVVSEVANHPLLEGYGRLLFPVTRGWEPSPSTRLRDLSLTWYNHLNPTSTVNLINFLLDRRAAGRQVFFDIYSEEEKAADPDKADTGLFFFPAQSLAEGERAPFAIWNAGGGFAYVGAMHDSLPHAHYLATHGLNCFALIYRPGWDTAPEDLGRAAAFILDHADELDVDPSGYATGGGSAGARMAWSLGAYGPGSLGAGNYPKPAAVIMQYTGQSQVMRTGEPATYACCGTSDGIANWRTMERRLEQLSAMGVPTEFHAYRGLPHGFGLGIGTVAEGWIDDAIAFWLSNR